MDVGVRLQSIRKLKGLSQRELAKRAGVTNSTISMIEKNSVSPSISSLKKVLDGIPISLADFFTLDLDPGPPEHGACRAGGPLGDGVRQGAGRGEGERGGAGGRVPVPG